MSFFSLQENFNHMLGYECFDIMCDLISLVIFV